MRHATILKSVPKLKQLRQAQRRACSISEHAVHGCCSGYVPYIFTDLSMLNNLCSDPHTRSGGIVDCHMPPRPWRRWGTGLQALRVSNRWTHYSKQESEATEQISMGHFAPREKMNDPTTVCTSGLFLFRVFHSYKMVLWPNLLIKCFHM